MSRLLKNIAKFILDQYHYNKISKDLERSAIIASEFEFNRFRNQIIYYLNNQRIKSSGLFHFSESNNETEIYSNTYALISYGLLNAIDSINIEPVFEYIYNSQNEDGFFRDEILQSELAETGQHWGWHHLVPHVIIAFDYLEEKPKYDFNKIIDMFENQSMSDWLASLDWEDNYLMTSNKIMNIGVLLQYSRDLFVNNRSGILVNEMKDWLCHEKFDENFIFKNIDINKSKYEISKAVNTIYHIAPLFIFDCEKSRLPENSIIKYVLLNQNKIGGYGSNIITDACSDIDSLYLLSQISNIETDISDSINRFLKYIFLNLNHDNGFVFKKYEKFSYGGNQLMSSHRNASNMFATWFRTLSIAFACEYLDIPNKFNFSKCPGYQFKIENISD